MGFGFELLMSLSDQHLMGQSEQLLAQFGEGPGAGFLELRFHPAEQSRRARPDISFSASASKSSRVSACP